MPGRSGKRVKIGPSQRTELLAAIAKRFGDRGGITELARRIQKPTSTLYRVLYPKSEKTMCLSTTRDAMFRELGLDVGVRPLLADDDEEKALLEGFRRIRSTQPGMAASFLVRVVQWADECEAVEADKRRADERLEALRNETPLPASSPSANSRKA